MEPRVASHSSVAEISESLWVSTEPDYATDHASGIWVSEPNSVRGSFRAPEDLEESALCCSLSVSEDGLSEYSESQSYYGSESGSRKSGKNSGAASPLTTVSDRSSNLHGNRSLPSPGYLSSRIASSVAGSAASDAVDSASGSFITAPSPSATPEELPGTGGVSPKRRTGAKGSLGGPKRSASGGRNGGDAARGMWLGKPGPPPPRGQVGFQSCLRPTLGMGMGMGVRTIMEEDEEGWDSDEDEEEEQTPTKPVAHQHSGRGSQPATPMLAAKTSSGEEKAVEDQPLDGRNSVFVRSSSDQSKAGENVPLSQRQRVGSEKAVWPSGRQPPAHEAPGCLCPVANTPEGSSISDSPPGSPRGDRLSMSVYFCGLPGTSRRRRSCGLCGRQVGRRALHCTQCRLVVYCDRRCMEQDHGVHARSCPGASASRLRESAMALKLEGAHHESEDQEEEVPLKRSAKGKGEKEEAQRKSLGGGSLSANAGPQKSASSSEPLERHSLSSNAVARRSEVGEEEGEQPLRRVSSGKAHRNKGGSSAADKSGASGSGQTALSQVSTRHGDHPGAGSAAILVAPA